MAQITVPESGQVVPHAFHGTTLTIWGVIAQDGFKLPPEDDPNRLQKWFGRGIYFYDGDPEAASKWPIHCPPGTKLVVLKARVEMGKMLDVQVTAVKRTLVKVAERLAREKVPWQEITDAAVIDFLAKKLDFDTVRGTGRVLQTPVRLHSFSRLPNLSPLIICVKKLDKISDISNVKEHIS